MRVFIICMLALFPFATMAQNATEDDRGYIEGLIEDNLSGDSRSVNIVGFAGALSSEATIEQLTIADADGVWLTLEGIVLTWNRSALLRGAIDVETLRAARVTVARAPLPDDTGPAPEAAPFALPELPVSVALGELDIDEIILGEVFLGEEIRVSLTGDAQLSGGEGSANIVATRLGGKTGVFEIDGSYVNLTRQLSLLLRVAEGPEGIAAQVLDLPGRPAIALEIAGDAPLDEFAATIAVGTDGQDRLNGTFALSEDAQGQTISLDVAGDISPLFAPDYQGFFGDDASLSVVVVRGDDQVAIPSLALDAGRVALNGRLLIDADGWPTLIDLRGGITPVGDAPVLLPLSGPRTFVDGMDLTIAYDADVADTWEADILIDGFTRPDLAIDALTLQGGGLLRSGLGAPTGAVTVDLQYGAQGLQFADVGTAQALGDVVNGALVASRVEGERINIASFTLAGAGLDARLQGSVSGASKGFESDLTLNAEVAGLARFAALVGQEISGAAQLEVQARLTPLDGLFDVTVTGETTDLAVGVAQVDAVLAGSGRVDARAVRDTEGTRIEALDVQTDAARIQGRADLTSDGADATVDVTLNELGMVIDGLSGPAKLKGDVRQTADGAIVFDIDGTGPAATFAANGRSTPLDALQNIAANLRADITDLSRYAQIADRPLAGALTLSADGAVLSDLSTLDVTFDGQSTDLETGVDRLDPLLAGTGRFNGAVARTGPDAYALENLNIRFPAMTLTGSADVTTTAANSADIDFRLNDAGLLDPSLEGPITLRLAATPASDDATDAQLVLRGAGAMVDVDAVIASPAQDREINGDVRASIASLSAFAPLVGQPIAGSVDLVASGSVLPDLSAFETQVNLTSTDLAVGNATVDPLLSGDGLINATIGLVDGVLGVRTLEISTDEVSIVGALNGAAGFGQGRFNASLRDVGVLTDQISGPVRARGAASLDEAGNWGIDATGTGPGGLAAQVVGQVGQNGTLAIEIDGSAPLALANTAIDPQRLSGLANFDLTVNGPPALSSLGGQVTFSNGRLAVPTAAQAFSGIGGQIALGGGRAQIGLTAQVEGGGSIAIDGPVALTGENTGDVTISLNSVVLQDPELYRTEVNGAINLNGPLRGGARIVGRLELGQTDVQVPSSSISSLGSLPDVTHVGASAEVRRTLDRAGLNAEAQASGAGNGGGGRAFPLDIVIDAPSRIFIRGRGVDAELGGQLRIGGTSDNVIPVGQFSLVRGRIDILQQRFDLTEGVASLQGSFDPFIRLVATTESDTGTVISIVVEGPAGAPEVSFISVPELPQDEVLAQLIFGRDLDSISPLQAVQLAAAISTLAGRGGGALDRLRESVGLDDFDVTTDDEGNAAVRAGAYLSENVYTDVTITSQGDTEINLNLDITDEVTAKGSVNQDGETGIGLFFERDY